MSKKTVPLLMTGTAALLALPVVGTLRGSARTDAPTVVEVEESCDGYVALTFDDGPTPLTPALLDVLEDHGARATMFNIGSKVGEHPELVEAELAAGHAVENHTQTHPDLATVSPGQVAAEITEATAALEAAGAEPEWFRPPFGNTDERVNAAVAAAGLREVIWTTDTFDWQDGTTTQDVVDRALAVEPGGIVLMHDGKQLTLDALPAILDGLAERGLCAGKIVTSTTEQAPAGWVDNVYRAKAGPWVADEA
jgi:peptidoglycan/xylan/chitin deacetylase (PgdA/CDA1 family)